jgi:hypothetical protein
MPESGTIEGFTSGNATHGGSIVSDKPAHDHDQVKNDFTRDTNQHPQPHDDHGFSKEEQNQK